MVVTVIVALFPGVNELGLLAHFGASAEDGVTKQVNETEVVKPLRADALNVNVEEPPAGIDAGVNAVADNEKSGGLKELNVAVMISSAFAV
jgi:hypothetical protein